MANKGIDNEEELIKLFKLIMLLHDVGKPNCKKINQKTGFDSFIKHEKESEEIADYILSDSFIYKKLVLWFIKNHEYINENTCTNKNSIRKRYKALEEVVKQIPFYIESADIMFMLPMLRLADISAQSKYKYANKFEENINFIKTLEAIIEEENKEKERNNMRKSIEVKYVPSPEYQGNNASIFNCVDCCHNDYEFNKQPCTLCLHSGYGWANYYDAEEI